MPAQKRRRRHKERRPRPSRQRPAERGQQSPIARTKLRTSDLPLQHAQLVAQDEDLDLLLALRPHPQNEQLQQPPQHPVEKRQHHALRTTHLDRRAYRLCASTPTPATATSTGTNGVSGTHSLANAARHARVQLDKAVRVKLEFCGVLAAAADVAGDRAGVARADRHCARCARANRLGG